MILISVFLSLNYNRIFIINYYLTLKLLNYHLFNIQFSFYRILNLIMLIFMLLIIIDYLIFLLMFYLIIYLIK